MRIFPLYMLRLVMPLVVPVAFLTSCYTPYRGVQAEDRATLTVHNATPRKLSVSIYRDATECTGREKLAPMLIGGEERTTYVDTHHELAMSFGQDLGVEGGYHSINLIGCVSAISFTPKPGRSYVLEVGANASNPCALTLDETSASGGRHQVPASEVSVRKYLTPFSETGAFCAKR